jgi:4-amino-4-deoxy-L-arabinose transferase-like glycosyltransferase
MKILRESDTSSNELIDQNWFRYAIYGITALFYFSKIGLNAIWTPNESFYAEAVREMFESGNYLEFFYNYEPRFNKPPLTYWLIAASVALFGLTEFAIRLPIVLLAFATNFLVAGMANRLYAKRASFWAFVCMAFSFQLVGNKQYASPEIPLTFFFTLTLLLFLIAWQKRSFWWTILAFLALGLTVLAKGYPYFIVVAFILLLFMVFHHAWNRKAVLKDAIFFLNPLGIALSLAIGLAWLAYMNFEYGEAFRDVLNAETLNRAIGKKPFSFEDLFFYPAVISWSFLPYSLAFYLAFFVTIKQKELHQKLAFPLAWVLGMLLIFTASSGKIPTYFIQAHPAMALLTAWFISNPSTLGQGKLFTFWKWSLLLPSILLITSGIGLVFLLDLPLMRLEIPLITLLLLLWVYNKEGKGFTLNLLPFATIFAPLFLFSTAVLPELEKYRPYREIGFIINQEVESRETPIYMEGRILHNLPFYAKRKMIRDAEPDELLSLALHNHLLALVKKETLSGISDPQILWEGYIYEKTSESRFAILVKAWLKARNGNMEAFEYYYLIYQNPE